MMIVTDDGIKTVRGVNINDVVTNKPWLIGINGGNSDGRRRETDVALLTVMAPVCGVKQAWRKPVAWWANER